MCEDHSTVLNIVPAVERQLFPVIQMVASMIVGRHSIPVERSQGPLMPPDQKAATTTRSSKEASAQILADKSLDVVETIIGRYLMSVGWCFLRNHHGPKRFVMGLFVSCHCNADA